MAEATLERIMIAINDRPIALTAGVSYATATDEAIARVGARVVLVHRNDKRVNLKPPRREDQARRAAACAEACFCVPTRRRHRRSSGSAACFASRGARRRRVSRAAKWRWRQRARRSVSRRAEGLEL
jgi:hypothetical protein